MDKPSGIRRSHFDQYQLSQKVLIRGKTRFTGATRKELTYSTATVTNRREQDKFSAENFLELPEKFRSPAV